MTDPLVKPCTAFYRDKILVAGMLIDVALAIREVLDGGAVQEEILVFEDATGRVVDLDLRGKRHEVMDRLKAEAKRQVSQRPGAKPPEEVRGPGRPKLGVVGREVTLMPRHWDWLNGQPGGASIALRKLVEEARRDDGGKQAQRERHEAAYRFMQTMAGDRPGFEEATRALFAGDERAFEKQITSWPADIRLHVATMAFPDSFK